METHSMNGINNTQNSNQTLSLQQQQQQQQQQENNQNLMMQQHLSQQMVQQQQQLLTQQQPTTSTNLNLQQPSDENTEMRKQEIGDILHQIMNITDQSLDEAQAR